MNPKGPKTLKFSSALNSLKKVWRNTSPCPIICAVLLKEGVLPRSHCCEAFVLNVPRAVAISKVMTESWLGGAFQVDTDSQLLKEFQSDSKTTARC